MTKYAKYVSSFRCSVSNISVTIPNLVRQMRISVFKFVIVAKPQWFRKISDDAQGSANKAHPLQVQLKNPRNRYVSYNLFRECDT